MEEIHDFGDGIELVVQLVPETGENNFQYLLFDKKNKTVISIDCFDATRQLSRIEGFSILAALATHHHWDHVGGIKALKEYNPSIEIVGGDKRVPGITNIFEESQSIAPIYKIGGFEISVIFTPCHTTGSICYYFPSYQCVFTGDTIFSGGVGRFFEGNANQMVTAVKRIVCLGAKTRIFPGHEYTVSNLKFANFFEPDNEIIEKELKRVIQKRSEDKFTIPSTIEKENDLNPFFRFNKEHIIKKTGQTDENEVMRIIRETKNNYRPK